MSIQEGPLLVLELAGVGVLLYATCTRMDVLDVARLGAWTALAALTPAILLASIIGRQADATVIFTVSAASIIVWFGCLFARYRRSWHARAIERLTGRPAYRWHMGPFSAATIAVVIPLAGGLLLDPIYARMVATTVPGSRTAIDLAVIAAAGLLALTAVTAPWVAYIVQARRVRRENQRFERAWRVWDSDRPVRADVTDSTHGAILPCGQ